MFGLDTNTIRDIKNCLAKFPQIDKALLYGSRAKGNYKNGSDIDLTLIGKNLSLRGHIYPLQGELDKLYLPYTFDISIFSKLSDLEFIEHILRVGKSFYQKEVRELPAGWEGKNLGDCIEKVFYTKKIQKKNFLEKGLFPLLSQEENFISGYWNNETDIFKIENKPIIIFGDHTRVVKYIDFDFVIGADGVKILRPICIIHPKYFYYFLLSKRPNSLGYARHFRLLKDLLICFPPLTEQKRIASVLDKVFQALDQIKANNEKNLANAKELWESCLNGVFAKPAKNWEKDKLFKLFNIQPPKKDVLEYLQKEDHVSFVPMDCLNIGNKNLTLKQTKLLKEAYSGYTYFAENDVLLAKITPCFENGKIGIAKNLLNGFGFGSSEFIVFRNKGKVLQDYLYYFLSQKSFRSQGKRRMGGAVGHKRLAKDFVENYLLSYPNSLAEQKRIVQKLDVLYQKMTELQEIYRKKVANVVELKKAVLRKAFTGELWLKK